MKTITIIVLIGISALTLLVAIMMPVVSSVAVHYAPDWMTYETVYLFGHADNNERQRHSHTIEATCVMTGLASIIISIMSGVFAGIIGCKNDK